MTGNTPLITVAIPTFNRSAYLVQAIHSAIGQTYRNIEILVLDNASSDDTEEVVRQCSDPRICYRRHKSNVGMMGNWNACLNEASGSFFLMLSDDDLLERDALESLLQPFLGANQASPSESIGMVYGRARLIDENGDDLGIGKSAPPEESFADLATNFICGVRPTYPCAILLRTEDAREAGGYPAQELPLAADAGLWMSVVARRGRAVFIDRPLVAYRAHAGSQTRTAPIDQWVSNNQRIAHCALSLMDAATAAERRAAMLRSVRKLNARVVCDLALLSFLHGAIDRSSALRTIAGYLRLYADPPSIIHLGLVLTCLAMPRTLGSGLVAFYRRWVS